MIAGANDELSPREQTFALKQWVPHAKEIVVPNAGHLKVFMGKPSIAEVLPKVFREFN
jgi:pimeloyl-ACP methyl ester carboxylesterase